MLRRTVFKGDETTETSRKVDHDAGRPAAPIITLRRSLREDATIEAIKIELNDTPTDDLTKTFVNIKETIALLHASGKNYSETLKQKPLIAMLAAYIRIYQKAEKAEPGTGKDAVEKASKAKTPVSEANGTSYVYDFALKDVYGLFQTVLKSEDENLHGLINFPEQRHKSFGSFTKHLKSKYKTYNNGTVNLPNEIFLNIKESRFNSGFSIRTPQATPSGQQNDSNVPSTSGQASFRFPQDDIEQLSAERSTLRQPAEVRDKSIASDSRSAFEIPSDKVPYRSSSLGFSQSTFSLSGVKNISLDTFVSKVFVKSPKISEPLLRAESTKIRIEGVEDKKSAKKEAVTFLVKNKDRRQANTVEARVLSIQERPIRSSAEVPLSSSTKRSRHTRELPDPEIFQKPVPRFSLTAPAARSEKHPKGLSSKLLEAGRGKLPETSESKPSDVSETAGQARRTIRRKPVGSGINPASIGRWAVRTVFEQDPSKISADSILEAARSQYEAVEAVLPGKGMDAVSESIATEISKHREDWLPGARHGIRGYADHALRRLQRPG